LRYSVAPAIVVAAGAATCQPALPAAGDWLPRRIAVIVPPDAAQFSDTAACGLEANNVHPAVPADCPLQAVTVYSAADARVANARTATTMPSWTLTLTPTIDRTPGRRWSSAPGSRGNDSPNRRHSN
jgi:hypothetical protein